MTALRVVIADDHPMVRYGIAAVLASVDRVELVGEASDGEELLAVVRRVRPDVVLTDLSMPRRSGIEAIRARGYLIKGADGAELVRAIEASPREDEQESPCSYELRDDVVRTLEARGTQSVPFVRWTGICAAATTPVCTPATSDARRGDRGLRARGLTVGRRTRAVRDFLPC